MAIRNFLGIKDTATEQIVGRASGDQSIRWKAVPDRFDLDLLLSITGVPWDPQAVREEQIPLYRSRLVVQEIKKGSSFDEFFAAMPSLSALMMLITIALTFNLPIADGSSRKAYGKRRLLGFLDVKARQPERFMSNCPVKQRSQVKMW